MSISVCVYLIVFISCDFLDTNGIYGYNINKKAREKIEVTSTPEIGRTVAHSRTEHVQILMQGTLNGYNRLFGGKLMEWIDVVAAVTARRHCGKNVTTAAVDSLIFKSPAMVNDTILLEGHVTYAGKTSMEVCVTTYVEELDGQRREINKAYLVLVAIDDDGRPTSVPSLIPETEEEKKEYAEALERRQNRKNRK